MGNLDETDKRVMEENLRAVQNGLTKKRAYVAPTVVVLGDIEDLTKNGGGTDMDLTSSQPA